MGTFITGVILFAIVALIIRNMIRNKKSGKSVQCGCGCAHCGGRCGSFKDVTVPPKTERQRNLPRDS